MRVVVVGAGLAGLAAARELAGDHDVIVLDKGAVLGGRLATRYIGDAVFDTGAQFFTVRGEALQAQTDDWLARDIARVWCRGFGEVPDGFPRYIGNAGMRSLADDLAHGLDCRREVMAFTIRAAGERWDVVTDNGAVERGDAVVLTCPVPQSWALLAQSGVELPDDFVGAGYHRVVALLAVLDRQSAVPDPGAVQLAQGESGLVTFVADNQRKGISPVPALTVHSSHDYSTANWDRPVDLLRAELLALAAPWIGAASVVEAHVQKWRFAGPAAPWPEPCWFDAERRIVLAGDAFAGPKFEGAYRSGLAAAAAVRAITA
jgi:renalase